MDEVFGEENFQAEIYFTKSTGLGTKGLPARCDIVIWYSKQADRVKYHQLFAPKVSGEAGATQYDWVLAPDGTKKKLGRGESPATGERRFHTDNASAMYTHATPGTPDPVRRSRPSPPRNRQWQTTAEGMRRLSWASRLMVLGQSVRYVRPLDDFPVYPLDSLWPDTGRKWFREPEDVCSPDESAGY